VSSVTVIVAFVALQRIAELTLARRNTRRLFARGAVEHGRRHYPLFVVLHALWLAAVLLFVPEDATVHWPFVALLVLLQAGRAWVIMSLGERWTTRILVLPGAPLVRRGPYRWLRHPNYLIVVLEIAALPLAFGAWKIALIFSAANLALLWWRIRVEEAALIEHARDA
jgi:methyltransferase